MRLPHCHAGEAARLRGTPLGYESFERRSKRSSADPKSAHQLAPWVIPTGSRPELFLPVSARLVSKPRASDPNSTSVVLLVDPGRRAAVTRSRSPRRRLPDPDRTGRVGARGSDPPHTRVRCLTRSHSHSPRPPGQGTRRDRTDHTLLGWSSAAAARLMVALAMSWRPPRVMVISGSTSAPALGDWEITVPAGYWSVDRYLIVALRS